MTGVHDVFQDLQVTKIHGDALLAITRLQTENTLLREKVRKLETALKEIEVIANSNGESYVTVNSIAKFATLALAEIRKEP